MFFQERAFIVFDSCFYDARWSTEKDMRMLLMNNRQFYSKLIITLQWPEPYQYMECADYVFMFKEHSATQRLRLYEQYGGAFANYEDFLKTFDKYTSDPYTCLVIKCACGINAPLAESVFWYKAG